MPSLRILIVPDKFKGTLTARQAGAAIAAGWSAVRPMDHITELPMADGGDGFGEILGDLLNARRRVCDTVDAAGRTRAADWWFEPQTRIAVIEAAEVNGLAQLAPAKFHPFALDTRGLGALLRDVAGSKPQSVYVGLGGSATNDGGFGLARSLGWKFWNATGNAICAWTELDQLVSIDAPTSPLKFDALTIAVDAKNPLLGPDGATMVYGPQKGLLAAELPHAERCLSRLAEVVDGKSSERLSLELGAGAAGGLGFGLRAFCGGVMQSGGELFAQLSGLEQRIEAADWVITAEGALDAQSLMGKGVSVVAGLASRRGKPCLCLAGSIALAEGALPWPNFRAYSIVPGIASIEASTAHAAECLRRLAAQVASNMR